MVGWLVGWMNLHSVVHLWTSSVRRIAKVSDKNCNSETYTYHKWI